MAEHPMRTSVRARSEDFVAELVDWLRIPSVSAEPERAGDVRRSADWLAAALVRTGFPQVEVWETGGLPAVYAHWSATDPAAPTVLLYGHHDVQPADPAELWATAPFEPEVRDGMLVGRGAADDKGQVLAHLLGLRALADVTGAEAPPVSLTVLVEGEEEVGSTHLPALLRARARDLACDVVVVSDTPMYAADAPTVGTGMRGMVYCQIDVHGPDVDLHSGSFGGAVPNPAAVLARLLAGLHDQDGRVTLPGFYDRVVPLSDDERAMFAALPYEQADFLRTAASRATAGEAGFSTLERLWARPTAEVCGLWGGYTGAGSKTIVPTDAHAKVSFRLVADQRPDEVEDGLRRYLERAAPPGIDVRLTFLGEGVRAVRTPPDDPVLLAAAQIVEEVFGGPVRRSREGGSGPEADLADVLGVPVVFLGFGLPTDRIHAPDEHVVLEQLLRGAEVAGRLWQRLGAEAGPRGPGAQAAPRGSAAQADPRRSAAEADRPEPDRPGADPAAAPRPDTLRAGA